MAQRIQTYAEFWPFYLGEHKKVTTRAFHYVGSSLFIALELSAWVTGNWRLIPAGVVCAYGFAWFSHFFIEKNRPATFTYPFWSLISDFRMLAMAMSFSLGRELRRFKIA
jgi:hypothetical protein